MFEHQFSTMFNYKDSLQLFFFQFHILPSYPGMKTVINSFQIYEIRPIRLGDLEKDQLDFFPTVALKWLTLKF